MGTREQHSFCRICVAMCGIVVTVEEPGDGSSRVVRVRGDSEHPLSRGYTCGKGRALPRYHHHPNRIDQVLYRSHPGAQSRAMRWEEALEDIAAIIRRAV